MFLGSPAVALWQQLGSRLRERLGPGRERGATAIEYAIMIALIAAVVVLAVTFLGSAANSGFESVQFP